MLGTRSASTYAIRSRDLSETALRQKVLQQPGRGEDLESRKGKSARTCKDENQETSGEESEGDGDNGGTKDGTKGAKDGTKEAEGVRRGSRGRLRLTQPSR